MNDKSIKIDAHLLMTLKSVIIGIVVYSLLSFMIILVLWFTSVSEEILTYCGALCISVGCFISGLKLGRGIGKRGILLGVIASVFFCSVIWSGAVVISQGKAIEDFSVLKAAIAVASGIVGGMVGVNTSR